MCPYICSLCLWLYLYFANRFMCVHFLRFSLYIHMNIRYLFFSVTHIYNGILFSHKKELSCAFCRDADGPRNCHTQWSKAGAFEKSHRIVKNKMCMVYSGNHIPPPPPSLTSQVYMRKLNETRCCNLFGYFQDSKVDILNTHNVRVLEGRVFGGA